MISNELQKSYFHWLYRLVCNRQYTGGRSYHKILSYLHSCEFIVRMERDLNRWEDGVNLRYRFGYDNNIDNRTISVFLDDRPCSVLELMVALAIKCEETMENPDKGDRTGRWFWDMMKSLTLADMDDDLFDPEIIEHVLHRFMEREYRRDGKGGLFTLKEYKRDLREVEIWYQMGWYLNELIEKGE